MDVQLGSTGVLNAYGAGARLVACGPAWKKFRSVNWSLLPFYENLKSASKSNAGQFLLELSLELGLEELFLPEPEFGRHTAVDLMLPRRLPLGVGKKRVTLRLGMKADAMRLRKGQTYGIAPGGCAVGWLSYPGNKALNLKPIFVVGHLGRDSLIDKECALLPFKAEPTFRCESIVHAMWAYFSGLPRAEYHRIETCVAFAIPQKLFSHPFNHPIHGERNRALCEYISGRWGLQCAEGGNISLEQIVKAQLSELGVLRENMHFIGSDIAGDPERWHTTRGPEEHRGFRNLVLVTRL